MGPAYLVSPGRSVFAKESQNVFIVTYERCVMKRVPYGGILRWRDDEDKRERLPGQRTSATSRLLRPRRGGLECQRRGSTTSAHEEPLGSLFLERRLGR